MKYLLFILLGIFTQQFSWAQPPGARGKRQRPKIGILFGVVKDVQNAQALEYATVSVFSLRDSALVGGAIVNSKGKFRIEKLPVGGVRVEINFLGYQPKTINRLRIPFNDPIVNLGKIELAPMENELGVAEVTAEKQVFQLGLDKKVFNVSKTDLGESENATEVLRNTPTVEVDFDGNVKIRGSGVKVYINGKPTGLTGDSQAEVLDQLPANSIKSVELITSPSAKYDPEGASGIINIILKKNILEGFTGSVNASVGTSPWMPFGKYRGGLDLNFRNNKVNIFSNFSYNSKTSLSRGDIARTVTLGDSISRLAQNSESERLRSGGMARIGMDYYLNDYNTLTLSTRLSPRGGGKNRIINYAFYDDLDQLNEESQRNAVSERSGMDMVYNLIYAKEFKKKKQKKKMGKRADHSKAPKQGGRWGKYKGGRGGGMPKAGFGTMGDKQELIIDLQYSNNQKETSETLAQKYSFSPFQMPLDSQQTRTTNSNNTATLMVDYTHPISATQKFETGYKGTLRMIGTDFLSERWNPRTNVLSPDNNLNNTFDFVEQVHAIYGTYAQKVNKMSYKLGLRVEQTLANSYLITTDERFINDYLSFFPSLSVSYQLKNNQQVQLGFSRRIERPSTWALNPFPSYSDPINLRMGNPFLMPQYSNSLELSYANYLKGGNLVMLTGFYRYNTDLMERIRTVDNGISVTSYQNLNSSHIFGGELVTRYVPYKWWSIGATGSAYYFNQDGTNINQDFEVNALTGNMNVNMNFTFKFGMRIAVYAWYSFPSLIAQGSKSGYTWNSFTISQKVLNNKGTVTFNVRNPLFGGRFSYTTNGPSFEQSGNRFWENPVFEMRYSHRFGKINVRNKRRSRAKNKGRFGEGSGEGVGI